jgi:cytoplasmic FMR1 interacting protein
VLTREKLCSGLSIFSKFLGESRKFLDSSTLWTGEQENLYDVMNNMEFHRLWSALQFVFCKPPISANEFTVE